jgi:hypothetical protein
MKLLVYEIAGSFAAENCRYIMGVVARPSLVADHFNQQQHGTSGKPFRVELQQQQNGELRCCSRILVCK